MTCVQSLDEWAKLLRCSIEEVAVTKHSKHIELLKTITLEIFEYVKLFNRDFEPIAGQLKDPSPSQAFAASEGLVDRRESLAKQRKPSLMADYSMLAEVHVLDGLDVAQHFQGIKSKSTLEMLFSNKLEARQKLKDVEKFTSRKEARSIDLLPNLIDGMDSLDKKGTVTWQSNLEKILEVCDGLQERYQMCLDEKRNFWSFVLGIVSIATFPFAVMTGYFGMNFHNMNGMLMHLFALIFLLNVLSLHPCHSY